MSLRLAVVLIGLLAAALLWGTEVDVPEVGGLGPGPVPGAGTSAAQGGDLRAQAGGLGRELIPKVEMQQTDAPEPAARAEGGGGLFGGRESKRLRRPRSRVHPQILRKLGIDADGHEARYIEDWIARLRSSQRRMLGDGLQKSPAQRAEFNRQAREFRIELIGFLGSQRAEKIAPELPLYGVDEQTGAIRRTDMQGRPRRQAVAKDNCDA